MTTKKQHLSDEKRAEELLDVLSQHWRADSQRSWSVIDYVREEVTRQRHDVTQLGGIRRVAWMLDAWAYALAEFNVRSPKPTLDHAIELGRIIEPDENRNGLRRGNVVIKNSETGLVVKRFPSFDQVPRLLELLFEQRDAMAPLDFYREFELIHPFMDGNGRVGKILLNWLSHSLLNPFFPPSDLFGDPIRNP